MTDFEAAAELALNDPFAAAMERADAVPTESILDVLAAFDSHEVSPLFATTTEKAR